jgi:hypothetical protein
MQKNRLDLFKDKPMLFDFYSKFTANSEVKKMFGEEMVNSLEKLLKQPFKKYTIGNKIDKFNNVCDKLKSILAGCFLFLGSVCIILFLYFINFII